MENDTEDQSNSDIVETVKINLQDSQAMPQQKKSKFNRPFFIALFLVIIIVGVYMMRSRPQTDLTERMHKDWVETMTKESSGSSNETVGLRHFERHEMTQPSQQAEPDQTRVSMVLPAEIPEDLHKAQTEGVPIQQGSDQTSDSSGQTATAQNPEASPSKLIEMKLNPEESGGNNLEPAYNADSKQDLNKVEEHGEKYQYKDDGGAGDDDNDGDDDDDDDDVNIDKGVDVGNGNDDEDDDDDDDYGAKDKELYENIVRHGPYDRKNVVGDSKNNIPLSDEPGAIGTYADKDILKDSTIAESNDKKENTDQNNLVNMQLEQTNYVNQPGEAANNVDPDQQQANYVNPGQVYGAQPEQSQVNYVNQEQANYAQQEQDQFNNANPEQPNYVQPGQANYAQQGQEQMNNANPEQPNYVQPGQDNYVQQGQDQFNNANPEQPNYVQPGQANYAQQGQDQMNNANPEQPNYVQPGQANYAQQGQDQMNNANPEQPNYVQPGQANYGQQGQDQMNNANPEQPNYVQTGQAKYGQQGQDQMNNANPEQPNYAQPGQANYGQQGQDQMNNANPDYAQPVQSNYIQQGQGQINQEQMGFVQPETKEANYIRPENSNFNLPVENVNNGINDGGLNNNQQYSGLSNNVVAPDTVVQFQNVNMENGNVLDTNRLPQMYQNRYDDSQRKVGKQLFNINDVYQANNQPSTKSPYTLSDAVESRMQMHKVLKDMHDIVDYGSAKSDEDNKKPWNEDEQREHLYDTNKQVNMFKNLRMQINLEAEPVTGTKPMRPPYKSTVQYPEYLTPINWETTFDHVKAPTFECVPMKTIDKFIRICIHPPSVKSQVSSKLKEESTWEYSALMDMQIALSQNKDAFLIDIGASFGVFSLAAAALNRNVIAVEPYSSHIQVLKQSVALNGFKNHITLFQAVISDRRGKVLIKPLEDHVDNVYIETVEDNEQSTNYTLVVNTVTLDDIEKVCPGRTAVLKIDIPGFEKRALEYSYLFFKYIYVTHVFMHWDTSDKALCLFVTRFFVERGYQPFSDLKGGPRLDIQYAASWTNQIVVWKL